MTLFRLLALFPIVYEAFRGFQIAQGGDFRDLSFELWVYAPLMIIFMIAPGRLSDVLCGFGLFALTSIAEWARTTYVQHLMFVGLADVMVSVLLMLVPFLNGVNAVIDSFEETFVGEPERK